MSYAYARPKARKGRRFNEVRPVAGGLAAVLDTLGGEAAAERRLLFRLWENWSMVMGPMLAELAVPLGHRGKSLLVGGEDNLVLQDLAFMREELLERVNAFMDSPRFDRVELHLVMARHRLDAAPAIQSPTRPRLLPERPPAFTGNPLEGVDPDSPVARCHAAYIRLHQRLSLSSNP